jgi:ABC-type Fe3+-hydroxamate transport system substrate-binding protein
VNKPPHTPETIAPSVAHGALLLVLALSACGPARRDDARASPRIVSLAPALTAVVTELGAASELVGVTRWCHAPGVAIVGDLTPRPEAILAVRPDVVLVSTYGSQAPDLAALTALGLDTRAFPLTTLADMRATTRALGALLERDGEGLIRRFDDALAKAPRPKTPVKVLLVYGLEPGAIITTGGGDHISALITALGGTDVGRTDDLRVTTRLGLERVLALAPDLILHAAPDDLLPDSAAALAHWSRWPSLPAVARAQVVVYPSDALARNGPHLAREIGPLSELLARAARAATP